MQGFCKLTKAATILDCKVEDFLEAGGKGGLRLYGYGIASIGRIEQEIIIDEKIGEYQYAVISESGGRSETRHFVLPQEDLKIMYLNYKEDDKQYIEVSSRYNERDEQVIYYEPPLKISREAILIKEQDLKNFVPSKNVKLKTNTFTSKALQKAIQCNNDLYCDGIPKDAKKNSSEKERIKNWIIDNWPDIPPGMSSHLEFVVKPTSSDIEASRK